MVKIGPKNGLKSRPLPRPPQNKDSGPMFFLARMFWGIFRADVFFGTDVLRIFRADVFFGTDVLVDNLNCAVIDHRD